MVDSRTLTRELIEASGVFALNIPTRAIAETTLTVGTLSGRDGDKFDALGLATTPARTIDVPLVAGRVHQPHGKRAAACGSDMGMLGKRQADAA